MAFMWPQIKTWLVTNLPTITGVPVFNGPPVSGDNPTSYITVGWTGTGDSAGDFQQTYADDGLGMLEDGTVLCDFVAQSGDIDLAGSETTVFAMADALNQALRADKSLGGLLDEPATIWLQISPQAIQNKAGSAVPLLVSVQYHCEVWS
jgi:hypothetical protein